MHDFLSEDGLKPSTQVPTITNRSVYRPTSRVERTHTLTNTLVASNVLNVRNGIAVLSSTSGDTTTARCELISDVNALVFTGSVHQSRDGASSQGRRAESDRARLCMTLVARKTRGLRRRRRAGRSRRLRVTLKVARVPGVALRALRWRAVGWNGVVRNAALLAGVPVPG